MVKTGNIKNRELLALFQNNLIKMISMLDNNNLIEIHQGETISHS